MVWGLYDLSLVPEGRKKIAEVFGNGSIMPGGPMTRSVITDYVKEVMARYGVDKALETVEQLMRLGFDATKASGASISPYIGQVLSIPKAPETNDASDWEEYTEEVYDAIMSLDDFENEDNGPQVLAVKSGARGSVASLARLVAPLGVLKDAEGEAAIVRSSFREGLTPDEMNEHTGVARKALWRLVADMAGRIRAGYASSEPPKSRGYGVIARAMRAKRPSMILARAAERGEEDPLTDIDARLFVGLLPKC
jgi:hypothetical protein